MSVHPSVFPSWIIFCSSQTFLVCSTIADRSAFLLRRLAVVSPRYSAPLFIVGASAPLALPPFAPYRSFCVQHPRSEHSAETLNDFLPPRHTSAPPRDGSNARSVRAGTTLTDVVSPAGSRFSPSSSCSSSSTSSSVSLPSLVHFFLSPRCFYCDEYL